MLEAVRRVARRRERSGPVPGGARRTSRSRWGEASRAARRWGRAKSTTTRSTRAASVKTAQTWDCRSASGLEIRVAGNNRHGRPGIDGVDPNARPNRQRAPPSRPSPARRRASPGHPAPPAARRRRGGTPPRSRAASVAGSARTSAASQSRLRGGHRGMDVLHVAPYPCASPARCTVCGVGAGCGEDDGCQCERAHSTWMISRAKMPLGCGPTEVPMVPLLGDPGRWRLARRGPAQPGQPHLRPHHARGARPDGALRGQDHPRPRRPVARVPAGRGEGDDAGPSTRRATSRSRRSPTRATSRSRSSWSRP